MQLSIRFIGFLSVFHAVCSKSESQAIEVSEVKKIASQLAQKASDVLPAKGKQATKADGVVDIKKLASEVAQKTIAATVATPVTDQKVESVPDKAPKSDNSPDADHTPADSEVTGNVDVTTGKDLAVGATQKQLPDIAGMIQAQDMELKKLREEVDKKQRQIDDLQKDVATLKEASRSNRQQSTSASTEKAAFLEANVQVEENDEDEAKREDPTGGDDKGGEGGDDGGSGSDKSKSSFVTPLSLPFLAISASAALLAAHL